MKLDIYSGVIAIIGKTQNGITVKVTGFDTCGSIAHLVNSFGKNCIETCCVESGKDLIFFEYNLRGELRNPQKLLKSLRSKLVRAGNIVQRQFDQEMSDQEHQIDQAYRQMPV